MDLIDLLVRIEVVSTLWVLWRLARQ